MAARSRRRRRARRTSSSSCSTTSASPSSAATAPTSTRPPIDAPGRRGDPSRQLPHHRARARRPGPACSPAATTTAAAWAAWPTWPRGFPGYWGRPPRENGFLSEILRANGYATYAVGKWHLSPEDETNMAGSRADLAARPRLRPLVRLPRRRDAPVRPCACTTTTTPSGRPAPSRTATTSAPTWPTGPSSTWATCAPSTTSCPSSSTSPPAPATRPTTRPPSGSSATGAASPRDGTAGATRRSPASSRSASFPRARCCRPGRPGSRAGTASTTRAGRWPSASWSASPRSSPTPTQQIGRVLDFIDDLGDADNTVVILVSDNGASSEGGKDGTINEGIALELRGRRRRTRCSAASTRSAARAATTTTRGAGRWRATRPSSAGSARSTRAASPTRASSGCPAAGSPGAGGVRRAVRPRHRHLPDRARAGRHRSAGRRSTGSPSRTSTAPASPTSSATTGRDAPGRHHTQHFEMLGSRAIYHDGWKAVTYHPVGPLYDDGLRSNAPWDDDVWELYHVAEDVSEVHDLAAEFPEKVAELVALWWEEARRNDVLPLDNRVLEVMAHKHDRRRPSGGLPLLPGRRAGARVGGRRRAQPLARHHGRRSTSPDGASSRTARSSRSAARSGDGRCTCSTDGCATSTTCTASTLYEVVGATRRSRRAPSWSSSASTRTRGAGGTADALVDGDGGRDRRGRPLHARRLQRGRDRA